MANNDNPIKEAEFDEWSNCWYCNLTGKDGSITQKIYGVKKEDAESNAKLMLFAADFHKHLEYMCDAWDDVKITGRNDIMDYFNNPAKSTLKNFKEFSLLKKI